MTDSHLKKAGLDNAARWALLDRPSGTAYFIVGTIGTPRRLWLRIKWAAGWRPQDGDAA